MRHIYSVTMTVLKKDQLRSLVCFEKSYIKTLTKQKIIATKTPAGFKEYFTGYKLKVESNWQESAYPIFESRLEPFILEKIQNKGIYFFVDYEDSISRSIATQSDVEEYATSFETSPLKEYLDGIERKNQQKEKENLEHKNSMVSAKVLAKNYKEKFNQKKS